MKIAVAKGDGIGPEIMTAVLEIFEANKEIYHCPNMSLLIWVNGFLIKVFQMA